MNARAWLNTLSLILFTLVFLPSTSYSQPEFKINVCKKMAPVLAGMGFKSPKNYSDCSGSYYLGNPEGRTTITRPKYKRDRQNNRYVRDGQRTITKAYGRIEIDLISKAAVQREFEILERSNNRPDEQHTARVRKLIDGKIQSETHTLTLEAEGTRRSYGKYKGGMYLLRAVGKTCKVTGDTGSPLGVAQPINDLYMMTAFFGFLDNDGHEFGIRLGISTQYYLSIYSEIPFITEEQVNGIAQAYAQFLEEELRSPADDYWEWLAGYIEQKENLKAQSNTIRVGLSITAKKIKALRRQWQNLMRLEMEGELDRGDSSIGVRDIFAPPAIRPSLRTVISFHEEREKLRTQMDDLRNIQTKDMEAVIKAMLDLRTSAENQAKKAVERKEELQREVQYLKDQESIFRLQFFDAAGWYGPHELPKLIRELDFENKAEPVVALQMKARLYLVQAETYEERLWFQSISPRPQPPDMPVITAARTARFEALLAYRKILEQDPENEEAKHVLLELDLQWLRAIGNKLEKEQKQSLAAMGAYLVNRGFSPDAPSTYWSGFWEYVGATMGMGPISIIGNLGMDVPGAVAETVDVTQTEIAKYLVSMVAITRLRKNGLTLAEIRNITPEILVEKIMFANSKGKKLSDEKATQFTRDIRETFIGLGDLKALAEGNLVQFNIHFGQAYYSPIDTEQSWAEWGGDLFSPKNLITLFGPSAIVSVGGKLTMPRLIMSPAEFAFAEHAGIVMRGRDLLGAALPAERMAEWFASHRLGYIVQQQMIRTQMLNGQLPRWASFINSGLKVGSATILMGAASHCAAESGIPGAQLLVDALFDFGAEELAFDILSRSGTPLRKFFGQVDDYGRFVVRQKGSWEKLGKDLDELQMIQRNASQAGDISEAASQRVQDLRGTIRHSEALAGIPADRQTAFAHGFNVAVEEVRRGNYDKAARAIGFSQKMGTRIQSNLDRLLEKINKVKALLSSATSSFRFRPQRELKKINESDLPELFVRKNLYPSSPARADLMAGDEAFRRGNMDEALDHYTKARNTGLYGGAEDRLDQAGLDLLEDRIALAANTRKSARILKTWQESTPPLPANRAIPDEKLGELVEQIQAGDNLTAITGSRNTVFEIVHKNAADGTGERYIFKTLTGENAADAVETEAICSALADAVGIGAPAARRLRPEEIRQLKSRFPDIQEGLITRAVDGTDLMEVTEPVAAAMKAQYARQRVFRSWIGDADGHFSNQLLGGDGRLWQIDFELGNVRSRKMKQMYASYPELPDEKSFIAQTIDFPRLESLRNAHLYQWMNRMDDMIHYNDMEEIVDAIGKLVNDTGGIRLKARLRSASLPEPEVERIFGILKERHSHLEELFKERFDRNMLPGSVSWLFPFESTVPPLRALLPLRIAA